MNEEDKNKNVGGEFSGSTPKMSWRDLNAITLSLVVGGLVVLGIAFITLVLNYFSSSQAAYQNLINQVNAQNTTVQVLSAKIDNLTNEVERRSETASSTR